MLDGSGVLDNPSSRYSCNLPREKFREATGARPCELCQAGRSCGVGDRGLIKCRGRSGPVPGYRYIGQATGDPQWALYRREDDDRRPARTGQTAGPSPDASPKRAAPKVIPPEDYSREARHHARFCTEEHKARLAAHLGSPRRAVDLVPYLGWYEELVLDEDSGYHEPVNAWVFPEFTGRRVICGLNRRIDTSRHPDYRRGGKYQFAGHPRGLSLTIGWRTRPGPVLIAEGMSDAMILAAAGLCAVGRPSNMGGADHLAELLKDFDREPIVLGENDQKPAGEWPGRDGATHVSRRLSEALGRPVSWVMPPAGSKDARAWFNARVGPDASEADWHAAGQEFLALVLAGAAEWERERAELDAELAALADEAGAKRVGGDDYDSHPDRGFPGQEGGRVSEMVAVPAAAVPAADGLSDLHAPLTPGEEARLEEWGREETTLRARVEETRARDRAERKRLREEAQRRNPNAPYHCDGRCMGAVNSAGEVGVFYLSSGCWGCCLSCNAKNKVQKIQHFRKKLLGIDPLELAGNGTGEDGGEDRRLWVLRKQHEQRRDGNDRDVALEALRQEMHANAKKRGGKLNYVRRYTPVDQLLVIVSTDRFAGAEAMTLEEACQVLTEAIECIPADPAVSRPIVTSRTTVLELEEEIDVPGGGTRPLLEVTYPGWECSRLKDEVSDWKSLDFLDQATPEEVEAAASEEGAEIKYAGGFDPLAESAGSNLWRLLIFVPPRSGLYADPDLGAKGRARLLLGRMKYRLLGADPDLWHHPTANAGEPAQVFDPEAFLALSP